MGSAMSSFENMEAKGCPEWATKPSLGDVPESCIASILMFLDAPEICKLASLNRCFRSASSSDLIWDSKLPSNYHFLARRVLGIGHEQCKEKEAEGDDDDDGGDRRKRETLTKQQIFSRLCRPNYFDGGSKQVLLDKITGNISLAISFEAMKITGIADRRYWNRIPTDESRFHTVAYLQQMWWVEVAGALEFQFLVGTYSLYFRLLLGKPETRSRRRSCNLDQVHGWDIKPVHFRLSASDGQHAMSKHYLSNQGDWVQYHVGDFVVEDPDTPIRIDFSMIQIDCTHTKGGLSVDSALICPSNCPKMNSEII